MSKDYYKILGVDKSATQDEIKKAFRKKAHKLHPDKQTGDEAKFKEVNEAYQVIGDEKKRSQYDQYGSGFDQQGGAGGGMSWEDVMRAQGQGGGQGFGGMNFDFGDLGDMFGFGGGSRRSRQQRGRDIQVDVEISLKESVQGIEKEISLTKNSACKKCTGSGVEPGSSLSTCGVCHGQGQVTKIQQTILGAMQTAATCTNCNGKGKIPKVMCKHCGGDGVEKVSETIKVKIPAGIDNGQSIRLSGRGEYIGSAGVAGDLYVQVHILPSQLFKREGSTLYSQTTINFAQAVLGDNISIATIDGEKTLVIPPGTQSHQQFRLKDRGVPKLNGHGRGDQYVTVIVHVPKKPSKKARQLIEELGKEMK